MSISMSSIDAGPLVVHSLFLAPDGTTVPPHPSVRTSSPVRYLECLLASAASLRLQEARCEIAVTTNADIALLGHRAARHLESLDVRFLQTDFRTRPGRENSTSFSSSRFVRDTILSATEGQPAERLVIVTDADCIWIDPGLIFAAAPAAGEIGCIQIPYPPDWEVAGSGEAGASPRALGELAAGMGGPGGAPSWIGGDLLYGRADALRLLVQRCEELDAHLLGKGQTLISEQQVLTLAAALGRARFKDLSSIARRIHTGPRHEAAPVENATRLGLWHLPAEKGLSLRRAALAVQRGHTAALRRDLADPDRAARRFNVAGAGPMRRFRDDAWIATQRIRAKAATR
jgi:hypothetical protein